MLNIQDAILVINKNIPNGKIQKSVVYHGLYLFQVFTDDPFEGELDPFYTVDMKTGEFRDFSILTDGDQEELAMLLGEGH